jgi:hypothetical protein
MGMPANRCRSLYDRTAKPVISMTYTRFNQHATDPALAICYVEVRSGWSCSPWSRGPIWLLAIVYWLFGRGCSPIRINKSPSSRGNAEEGPLWQCLRRALSGRGGGHAQRALFKPETPLMSIQFPASEPKSGCSIDIDVRARSPGGNRPSSQT